MTERRTTSATGKEPTLKSHWQGRKRFMYMTSAFFMTTILYIIYKGQDTGTAQTAMYMAFGGLIANTGAYTFGVSWEDILMARSGLVRTNTPFVPTGDKDVQQH